MVHSIGTYSVIHHTEDHWTTGISRGEVVEWEVGPNTVYEYGRQQLLGLRSGWVGWIETMKAG